MSKFIENYQKRMALKDKDLKRKVVARFARGNIRLQQGRYITQKDIDDGLARIRERAIRYGD